MKDVNTYKYPENSQILPTFHTASVSPDGKMNINTFAKNEPAVVNTQQIPISQVQQDMRFEPMNANEQFLNSTKNRLLGIQMPQPGSLNG